MVFNGGADCKKCSHKNICSIKKIFENTETKIDDLSSPMIYYFEIQLKHKGFIFPREMLVRELSNASRIALNSIYGLKSASFENTEYANCWNYRGGYRL